MREFVCRILSHSIYIPHSGVFSRYSCEWRKQARIYVAIRIIAWIGWAIAQADDVLRSALHCIRFTPSDRYANLRGDVVRNSVLRERAAPSILNGTLDRGRGGVQLILRQVGSICGIDRDAGRNRYVASGVVLLISRAVRGDGSCFAIRVRVAKWVVANIGVFIPALRIAHVGILVEGIWRHEPTHRTAEVPSTKVIKAGLGVAFFAGEFAVLGAGVGGEDSFATEGIEIGVVAGSGLAILDDFAGRAEVVREVVEDVV